MKVTLTKAELKELVRKHYNLPDTVAVEIADNELTDGQVILINEISCRFWVYKRFYSFK